MASRQPLPVTLSIHGGALIDRFGPRKVIVILGLVGTASTLLFPVLPFLWAVILLQMIVGFAETTSWIGAQAVVAQLMRGQPVYAGRMTACARAGGAFGPLLVGFSWVHFGPAGGFLFFALWSFGGAATASFLPRRGGGVGAIARRADVLPKASDYRVTLRMLALAAVALVIAATFLRQTGSGMQASFYAVWRTGIGFSADAIGLLIGIGNGVSALAALAVGPLTRRVADCWLLIVTVGLAIVGVAFTPMIEGFVPLAVAIGLRGAGQGLNLPLMMSIAARAVAPDLQGRVAALRVSFNRLGNAVFPVVMGGMAELVGLEYAFYAVGGAGILLLCLLSVWAARSGDRF